ncbi:Serine/threonine-protein phosphatase BSU1 [Diplonema papillatum]|nr:Serine/threonine-protein phosphatase BSU1 [Diplonema papillatum]
MAEVVLRLITPDSDLNPATVVLSDKRAVTFGRERVDVVLTSRTDANAVSRRHATLEYCARDGVVAVVDCSSNGTLANFSPCPKGQPAYVRVGEKVTFGKITDELTYVIQQGASPCAAGAGAPAGKAAHPPCFTLRSPMLCVGPAGVRESPLQLVAQVDELLQSVDEEKVFSASSARKAPNLERSDDAAGQALAMARYLSDSWAAGAAAGLGDPSSLLDKPFPHTLPARRFAESVTVLAGNYLSRHAAATSPLLLRLASPMFVLGDLHGSFFDLHSYVQQLTPFGDIRFTGTPLCFLGDYVDRGRHGVELVAYLLALKIVAPEYVFILRGNHEDEAVNSDVQTNGDGSFLAQCHALFGKSLGGKVWTVLNTVFSTLPVAAIVDNKVFLCHGGVPRMPPLAANGEKDQRRDVCLADLDDPGFPRFRTVLPAWSCLGSFFESSLSKASSLASPADGACFLDRQQQLVRDLLWSDPSAADVVDGSGEVVRHPPSGRCSDGAVVEFSGRAVDDFFEANGFDLLVRGHQFQQRGVRVAKSGRVVTVFSTTCYGEPISGSGGVVLLKPNGSLSLVNVSRATAGSSLKSAAAVHASATMAALRMR